MKDYLDFLTRKARESSDLDGRPGTMVGELALKPMTLISKFLKDSITSFDTLNSITSLADLSDDELESFGKRFFVNWNRGGYSATVVQIYFTVPTNARITTDLRFKTEDGYVFLPRFAVSITATQMSANLAPDGMSFFTDVPVLSESPDTPEIPVDGISMLENADFQYLKVANSMKVSAGSSGETRAQFEERLQCAANDRSFLNLQSILANISEQFPHIRNISLIGPGNVNMVRDLIQAIPTDEIPGIVSFFGKYPGDLTVVKSSLYQFVFPPDATATNNPFDPINPSSNYDFPLSVRAIEANSQDPAEWGCPTGEEATADMYRGLYKEDGRSVATIQTVPLLDLANMVIVPGIKPTEDFKLGVNNKLVDEFGKDDLQGVDVFETTIQHELEFKGGTDESLALQYDINKRVGIRMTGEFVLPGAVETEDDNPLMFFLIGGRNQTSGANEYIQAFSGFGFAVKKHIQADAVLQDNYSNVYLVNTDRDITFDIFSGSEGIGSEVGWALASSSLKFIGLTTDYSAIDTEDHRYGFELVINEDLSMYLKIWGMAENEDESDPAFFGILTTRALQVASSQINNPSSEAYGSLFTLSMQNLTENTGASWVWTVSNILIETLMPRRSMCFAQMDLSDISRSVAIRIRARSFSVIEGGEPATSWNLYLWNTEAFIRDDQDPRISGVWELIRELSNVDIDVDQNGYITKEINILNIDQYSVINDSKKILYMLIMPSGRSQIKTREEFGASPVNAESQTVLDIDYISIKDSSYGQYHMNDKADIYINSFRNNDETSQKTITFTTDSDGASELYLLPGIEVPILEIVEVVLTSGSVVLGEDEYTIYYDDDALSYSARAKPLFLAENYPVTEVQVTYSYFKNLLDLQTYFESRAVRPLVGDVLIYHKRPVYVDYTIDYKGGPESSVMRSLVADFVDTNFTKVWDISDLITFIQNQGANYVKTPVIISYERTDENGVVETGEFSSLFSIGELEFFKFRTVVFNRTG